MKRYKKRTGKDHKCPEWASLSIGVSSAQFLTGSYEAGTVMLPLDGTSVELDMFFGRLFLRAMSIK